MIDSKADLEAGQQLHGHKSPVMPLGVRAGAAAMNKLGVEGAKKGQRLLLALGLTAVVAGPIQGCAAHTTTQAQAPAATVAAVPDKMPPCSLKVPGTTATFTDTADGIAVDIVTTGSVEEVRSRMRGRMAYAKAHPQPMPLQVTKEAEDIPGGIRMIVHSVDPTKVDKVRAGVRKKLSASQQQDASQASE